VPATHQTIDINAPIDVVYGVITDYAKYPEFVKEVSSVKILKDHADGKTVEQTANIIKSLSYTIRLVEKPNTEVSWTLVTGQFLKKNSGRWVLSALPGGGTRAEYSLEIGVSRLVPKKIVDGFTGASLRPTLEAFKKRAESLAG